MRKLLTITIPTYNAEKTLAVCLDSLCIPELLDRLDILVINDGSKDASAAIARQYAKKYPASFRLITKENGGHGSGINTGLREAKGVYFKVLDADDWFDPDGLCELIRFLEQKTAEKDPDQISGQAPAAVPDLVSSQFLWVLDNGTGNAAASPRRAQFTEPFPGVKYQTIYRLPEVAQKLYVKFHNLTVRTALLREHRIRMDEHCYYEDAEYALYPFAYAKTIAFTEKPVYLYRIGSSGQSMSREKLLKNVQNYDLVLGSLLQFTAEHRAGLCPEVRDYFERFLARFYAGRIKIALNMPIGYEAKKSIRALEQDLKEHHPEIYRKNINTPLKLLRGTGYLLYLPAALLIRLRGTIGSHC